MARTIYVRSNLFVAKLDLKNLEGKPEKAVSCLEQVATQIISAKETVRKYAPKAADFKIKVESDDTIWLEFTTTEKESEQAVFRRETRSNMILDLSDSELVDIASERGYILTPQEEIES